MPQTKNFVQNPEIVKFSHLPEIVKKMNIRLRISNYFKTMNFVRISFFKHWQIQNFKNWKIFCAIIIYELQ